MSSQIPNSNDPFAVPSPLTSAPDTGVPSVSLPITTQGAAVPGIGSTASEGEGIEQEWLDRTHHVMQSFSTDPYQLSKEFAAVRAEYIKHRYGKVIRMNSSKDGKES